MRDPSRIGRLLDLLRTIWVNNPDLRLGQIVVNCMPVGDHAPPVFFVEDTEVEAGMRRFVSSRCLTDPGDISITLTKSEAVVLMHLLAPFEGVPQLPIADSAEAQALHNLCCLLEKQLVEPFRNDWDNVVAEAKKNLGPME